MSDTILYDVLDSDPGTWMEQHFYIEDPRDPDTGEIFEPGPIILQEFQKKLLRYATLRLDGKFPFSTILYSTIKKSGKTRVAAGVGAWFAATQGAYNEVYCLANDGKQSKDRILSAIKKAIELNSKLNWNVTRERITLPNKTFIEALPCDPTGQAGSNPGLTIWSEMWGARQKHQERLWTEMTIPPTRQGHALRWVESYAGFSGESNVLENLYLLATEQGVPHPAFDELPVYVNTQAKLFAYWDEGHAARRMPWQTDDYYVAEAATLRTSEFDRIHQNLWVDPVTKAIPIEWWDKCNANEIHKEPVPPLDRRTPVVIGIDAGITGDCTALVIVSRNPFLKRRDPEYDKQIAIRGVRVWEPPVGGRIDLTMTLERALEELCERYNVVEVCYDKYQLEKLARDMRREGVAHFKEFSQAGLRAIADNQLYQMIVHRRVIHSGEYVLRTHVDNAAAKQTGDKMRFVKPDESVAFGRTKRPIDAVVCASMAGYRCLKLIL